MVVKHSPPPSRAVETTPAHAEQEDLTPTSPRATVSPDRRRALDPLTMEQPVTSAPTDTSTNTGTVRREQVANLPRPPRSGTESHHSSRQRSPGSDLRHSSYGAAGYLDSFRPPVTSEADYFAAARREADRASWAHGNPFGDRVTIQGRRPIEPQRPWPSRRDLANPNQYSFQPLQDPYWRQPRYDPDFNPYGHYDDFRLEDLELRRPPRRNYSLGSNFVTLDEIGNDQRSGSDRQSRAASRHSSQHSQAPSVRQNNTPRQSPEPRPPPPEQRHSPEPPRAETPPPPPPPEDEGELDLQRQLRTFMDQQEQRDRRLREEFADLRKDVNESLQMFELRQQLEKAREEKATLQKQVAALKSPDTRPQVESKTLSFKTDSFPVLKMEEGKTMSNIEQFCKWRMQVGYALNANLAYKEMIRKTPEVLWNAIAMCQKGSVSNRLSHIRFSDVKTADEFFEEVQLQVCGSTSQDNAQVFLEARTRKKNEEVLTFVSLMEVLWTMAFGPIETERQCLNFVKQVMKNLKYDAFVDKWVWYGFMKTTTTVQKLKANVETVTGAMLLSKNLTTGNALSSTLPEHKGNSTGKKETSADVNYTNSSSNNPYCHLCEDSGHWTKNCNYQRECSKWVKEKKAKKSNSSNPSSKPSSASGSGSKPKPEQPKPDANSGTSSNGNRKKKNKPNSGAKPTGSHIAHVDDSTAWTSGNISGQNE